MAKLHQTFALAALLLALPPSGVARETCATLEACLAKYPKAAPSSPGIGPKERELSEAVVKYGARAIPGLIKLLDSEQANARQLAGYTLSDIEGLRPEHLPALIKARKNGDGWIPPAIARVGTPEAVAFLVEDLRNDPENHTQVTWALQMLGARAAPALAELYACVESCNDNLLSTVGSVLGEMKANALDAVPRLLQIARDRKFDLTARRYAVLAIGDVGESAATFVPQLLKLKSDEPTLGNVIDSALTDVGSAEAVPSLVQALPTDPERILRQIAQLQENGYAAGPTVLRYLDDGDWNVRVAAAETLGDIGYKPAEPALIGSLSDQDDWKLVYSAVLSLAQLKSRASVEALQRVRDSHWYPPVRTLAHDAIAHIEKGSTLKELEWRSLGPIEGSPATCATVREKIVRQPDAIKLYQGEHVAQMMDLAYPAEIHSFGAEEGTQPDKNGIIVVNQGNMVEHVEKIRQVPDVALKVADGWLVGSDRGEWGGELVHIPAHGKANILSDENVQDIFPLGDRIVAITGLAHLGMNGGALLTIYQNETGRYMAVPWKRLPAAPDRSSLLHGNRVLINTSGGGSVIVDANGTLRMAECQTTR